MTVEQAVASAAPVREEDGLILDVRELTKEFVLHNIDSRSVSGLSGVSFRLSAGEHIALAGTSGAGKSSLLRAIYRTYKPTTGNIFFTLEDGNTIDLVGLSDQEVTMLRGRQIGYVSQFLRAQPRRSALDLVTRAGVYRGMGRDEARDMAATSLRRLNIGEHLWDVHVSVLSGGEKQRVNLAAGLISPPRLLLLDEPVSALDPENRESAIDLIAELSQSGVAVLAVFHDLDAISRLATRIIVLEKGTVTRSGPTDHILPSLTVGDVQP
jgi:alpha-D-ribose 1-methylphosphonate 5-triphosphate synthase subunit PhnL